MKTLYQIAKETNFSHQRLSTKLTPEFFEQYKNHIIFEKGKRYFDETAEAALIPANNITKEYNNAPFVQYLINDVEYLKEKLEESEKRNHELILQIAEMNKANQILLANKKGLFKRLFTRAKE